MILRFATPDDVPAVLGIWKLAAQATPRGGDDTAAVRALIARAPAALRLAVDNGGGNGDGHGDIVGSLIAGFDGWRCHLYRFAVHPARRRQGIGAMLLADAEERFRGFGGRRADAMVLDGNSLAHHAWAAAGYTPQDDWRRWVKSL